MTPFDIHYLICLSENRTFFYWRSFAKLLLSHQKTTIRFPCSHPLTSNCLLPKSLNHPPFPYSTPYAIRALLQTLDLNSTSYSASSTCVWRKKNNVYARAGSIFKDLTLNHHLIFTSSHLLFSISISFSNRTSSADVELPTPKEFEPPTPYAIRPSLQTGCRTYTMPRSFRLFSIRHTTTIILVDSNFNLIQGGLRHNDWSTTITNRDAFNTVTEQPLPSSTTSLGNEGKVVIGSWSI
jgi:hypothetical protein